jgi:glycosyltransferase involved in cell wall biosynthesis
MTFLFDESLTGDRLLNMASARAKRDRAKIIAAQARAEAIESRLSALERSISWRAGGPARRAARLLRRLLTTPASIPPSIEDPPALQRQTRGLALVVDHNWPQPDRDSGSVDIVNLVRALAHLQFDTILAASKEHAGEQPARDRLIRQGLRCLLPEEADSVAAFIQAFGPKIDLCIMCRVYCGGEFLEKLQRHAPQARLLFNSIDLNYLREERRARLLQDKALLAMVQQLRHREEQLIRHSDATFVVSTVERDLLAKTMPDSLVVHMPLARETQKPKRDFADRNGIGFIGGFAHAPNVDAIRYFMEEIWPLVQQSLPDCEFSIVGADAPADLALGARNVRVLGHLSDVDAWFESVRMTVAPLRYGAGAKGKVASSLARGVPCIATSIASEGMTLAEYDTMPICDNPSDFAAAVVEVYENEELWRKFSLAGLRYADRMMSPAAWQRRLDAALSLIGL